MLKQTVIGIIGRTILCKNEGEKNYMSYSSTSSAHKLNHGDIYNNSNSGVTTEVVTNAFNMVKARLQAAGLTPPGSSDILGVAENFYIKAELVWKGRMMGDLPSGANGSMSTYDNVNKSYAMFPGSWGCESRRIYQICKHQCPAKRCERTDTLRLCIQ